MKAIEFPEVNVRIAENQPQYETLPVHIDRKDGTTPTTMCIQLDPEEIKQVAETGRIWMQVLTFGQPFHPIMMSFMKPEGFTEPQRNPTEWTPSPEDSVDPKTAIKMKKLFFFYECDYIAANTKEEAVEFYKNEGGIDGRDMEEAIEEVEEIDEQKMKDTIINIDVEDEDTGEIKYVPVPLFDVLQEAEKRRESNGAFRLIMIEP